jgi:hypothetical protein
VIPTCPNKSGLKYLRIFARDILTAQEKEASWRLIAARNKRRIAQLTKAAEVAATTNDQSIETNIAAEKDSTLIGAKDPLTTSVDDGA